MGQEQTAILRYLWQWRVRFAVLVLPSSVAISHFVRPDLTVLHHGAALNVIKRDFEQQ
jgi:hypothetical protein